MSELGSCKAILPQPTMSLHVRLRGMTADALKREGFHQFVEQVWRFVFLEATPEPSDPRAGLVADQVFVTSETTDGIDQQYSTIERGGSLGAVTVFLPAVLRWAGPSSSV